MSSNGTERDSFPSTGCGSQKSTHASHKHLFATVDVSASVLFLFCFHFHIQEDQKLALLSLVSSRSA